MPALLLGWLVSRFLLFECPRALHVLDFVKHWRFSLQGSVSVKHSLIVGNRSGATDSMEPELQRASMKLEALIFS